MRKIFILCSLLLFLTICSCTRKETVEFLNIETIIEKNGFDLGEYGIIARPPKPIGPLFRVLEIQRIAPGEEIMGTVKREHGSSTQWFDYERSNEETILIWLLDEEQGGLCSLILRPRSCPTTARLENTPAARGYCVKEDFPTDAPSPEIEEPNAQTDQN